MDYAMLIVWDEIPQNGSSITDYAVQSWVWTNDTRINDLKVADLDQDGTDEIITVGYYSNSSGFKVAQITVWDNTLSNYLGGTTWQWDHNTEILCVDVADIKGDSDLEVVTGGYFMEGLSLKIAQVTVWDDWNGTQFVNGCEDLTTWVWGDQSVVNDLVVGYDVDGDGNSDDVVTVGYYHSIFGYDFPQVIAWTETLDVVDGDGLIVEEFVSNDTGVDARWRNIACAGNIYGAGNVDFTVCGTAGGLPVTMLYSYDAGLDKFTTYGTRFVDIDGGCDFVISDNWQYGIQVFVECGLDGGNYVLKTGY